MDENSEGVGFLARVSPSGGEVGIEKEGPPRRWWGRELGLGRWAIAGSYSRAIWCNSSVSFEVLEEPDG